MRRPRWWLQMWGSPDVASCREVAAHLQSYLDGAVGDVQHRRIARHLEFCRRCGLEESAYRSISAALARRGAAQVDDDTLQRLHQFASTLQQHGAPEG